MPDDQPDDIFSAWGRVQSADPSTRRSGVMPTTPQNAPETPAATPDASPPPQPQPAPAPSQGAQSPAPGGQSIVSTATSLIGKNAASIRPFLQQTNQSLDPTRANWCAAFVDGVLAANGIPGTSGAGKYVATGFLNWGSPVKGDPQPGDVLVQPRGHPAGELGGHVGIATGQVAEGNGQTYYLMQSGNLHGHVSYSWEPAQSVVARRAPQPSEGAQD